MHSSCFLTFPSAFVRASLTQPARVGVVQSTIRVGPTVYWTMLSLRQAKISSLEPVIARLTIRWHFIDSQGSLYSEEM